MEIFHLDDMTPGQRAEVLALRTESRMRRRLLDLGLVPGTRVECVGQSPGGDPKAYLIRGAAVAIRSEDARTVTMRQVVVWWPAERKSRRGRSSP